MKTLRIVQLNLNNKRQEERLTPIAEAFSHCLADVVMVQEVNDKAALLAALLPHGYCYSRFVDYKTAKGQLQSVGIISKLPLEDSPIQAEAAEHKLAVAALRLDKRTITLISAHYPWGGNTEQLRVKLSEAVDYLSERVSFGDPSMITIFAGDLNAEPDYRSIRFLTGKEVSLDGNRSTYWTDAWSAAGNETNEFTSRHSTNIQGRVTAFGVGIAYPGFIPDRRIDYIFTRGWCYGKEGGPVSFGNLSHPRGIELSDHEGIYADILIELN